MVLKTSENMLGKQAPEPAVEGQVNLIMIICNHCPYVLYRIHAISNIVRDYRHLVNCIAINSNDATTYKEDAPEYMPKFKKDYDLQCDYIYDEDQSIAYAYGAVCTPEFYVVNPKGIIVYHGELDPSHTSNELKATGSSLRHALDLTLVGKPVNWEINPSFGCSIKWRTDISLH